MFSAVNNVKPLSAKNVIAQNIYPEGGVTVPVVSTNIDPYCPNVASCAFDPDK